MFLLFWGFDYFRILEIFNCKFGSSEIKYLGFKVNEKELQIDDGKIQPILEFPKPKNIKQLFNYQS